MAANGGKERGIRRLMGKARMRAKEKGRTEHLYGETRYAAKTWSHQRRVVMKAEVVRHPGRDPQNNPRFVVTNLAGAPPTVYEQVYPPRGAMANPPNEVHSGREVGPPSPLPFLAHHIPS